MQALDLLPSAPVSTNGAEPASTQNPRGHETPDGEFGRMMEQAMSPGGKDKADTKATSSRDNTPVKSHAVKAQSNQKTTTADPNPAKYKTEDCDKSQAASNLSSEPATTPKEKPTTDAIPILPIATDDTIEPLPAFLTLPLMGHLANGNTDVKTTAVTGNTSSTQLVAAIGVEKAPSTSLTGKNPVITTPEKTIQPAGLPPALDTKSLVAVVSPAPQASEPSNTKPVVDAKATPPPVTASLPQPEPAKTESTVPVDPKADAAALTDDKLQAANPTAPKVPQTSKNDGTGVAITASSMKKTENTNKVAGLDVQVLPGGKTDAVRETVLPAHAVVTPVRTSDKQTSDLNLPLPSTAPATTDTAETAGIIALPSLADARMRDVERTHDLVSLHALRMVESNADLLQVVIKPGGGTELSLELRHRNGALEAEAVLQRGDFQLMSQHWPELQLKLEQRGIKLAPLGGDTNFSAPDNGNFSRQQQSAREEAAQQASAFAEFTVAMNRGGATARLAPVTAGGWESWA